jgi:DNA-binding transcriptional regulator YhcF (GntR family)
MHLEIDSHSATPPFEQLRTQVIAQISAGTLVAGTRLPTVRQLAEELGLATNTVARAYKELEAAELIETRGRAGSFVKAASGTVTEQALAAALIYATRIRELGVSEEDAAAYVAAALSRP